MFHVNNVGYQNNEYNQTGNLGNAISRMNIVFSRIDRELAFDNTLKGSPDHCAQFAKKCIERGLDMQNAVKFYVEKYKKSSTECHFGQIIKNVYEKDLGYYGTIPEMSAYAIWRYLKYEMPDDLLSTVHPIRESIELKTKEAHFEGIPLIRQRGAGLIFKNSFVMLRGEKGTLPSKFAQSILASVLYPKDECTIENLDLACGYASDTVGVYIDTRHDSSRQVPEVVQGVGDIVRENVEKSSFNFEFTCISNLGRKSRMKALEDNLTYLNEKHEGKHLLVIIDQISNLCIDPNDPVESYKVIEHLKNLRNSADCTFVCVYDENLDSDAKSDSHIAVGLENEADIYLEMTKVEESDTDVRIRSLGSKDFNHIYGIYVKYDSDLNQLVYADNPSEEFSISDPLGDSIASVNFPASEDELIKILDYSGMSEEEKRHWASNLAEEKTFFEINGVSHYLEKNTDEDIVYSLRKVDWGKIDQEKGGVK